MTKAELTNSLENIYRKVKDFPDDANVTVVKELAKCSQVLAYSVFVDNKHKNTEIVIY